MISHDKKNIGERLSFFREKELSKTQHELSCVMGCKKSKLSRIENDKQPLDLATLLWLYENHNLNPLWLLLGRGGMFDPVDDGDGKKKYEHINQLYQNSQSRIADLSDSIKTKNQLIVQLQEKIQDLEEERGVKKTA